MASYAKKQADGPPKVSGVPDGAKMTKLTVRKEFWTMYVNKKTHRAKTEYWWFETTVVCEEGGLMAHPEGDATAPSSVPPK